MRLCTGKMASCPYKKNAMSLADRLDQLVLYTLIAAFFIGCIPW